MDNIDINTITLDEIFHWVQDFLDRKFSVSSEHWHYFGTIGCLLKSQDTVSDILNQLKEAFKGDATEFVYKTYSSYHRLLCHNLGFCLGYKTERKTKNMVKYVGCHDYDVEAICSYSAYCACDKMPDKITKRGISYTEYDSDHDDDFSNHFYPLPRTAIIGVTFTRVL